MSDYTVEAARLIAKAIVIGTWLIARASAPHLIDSNPKDYLGLL